MYCFAAQAVKRASCAAAHSALRATAPWWAPRAVVGAPAAPSAPRGAADASACQPCPRGAYCAEASARATECPAGLTEPVAMTTPASPWPVRGARLALTTRGRRGDSAAHGGALQSCNGLRAITGSLSGRRNHLMGGNHRLVNALHEAIAAAKNGRRTVEL